MKEKTNLFNRFMNFQVVMSFRVLAVIVAMITVITYLSISATNTVVMVNGSKTGNSSFVQNGYTYVPLNEIAQKMGDSVTAKISEKKIVIKQKNETIISVIAIESKAMWNGRIVPLKTKTVKNAIVPVDAKAIYKNGQVYVPIEFLSASKGMGYPVKVLSEGGKTMIYIGTIPKPAKPITSKPEPVKPSTQTPQPDGKIYPDGWVAPVLKSAWSSKDGVNSLTLQNELGFKEDGSVFGIKGKSKIITVVGQSSSSPIEVELVFYAWTDKALAESYRVPIVAKELFKLYFGSDATRVWNYCNNNDIPETFTANGRKVNVIFSEADGAMVFQVGKKLKN